MAKTVFIAVDLPDAVTVEKVDQVLRNWLSAEGVIGIADTSEKDTSGLDDMFDTIKGYM